MIQFLLHIIGYDIWFYFSHKLLHTRQLYFIHKPHHYYYEPKFLDFYKCYILEVPIVSVGFCCPLLFIYYKIFLLNWFYTQMLYAFIFINIRGLMEHDKRTVFIVGNHHLKHHLQLKCNYGEYWLDYLFGTLHDNS